MRKIARFPLRRQHVHEGKHCDHCAKSDRRSAVHHEAGGKRISLEMVRPKMSAGNIPSLHRSSYGLRIQCRC